MEVKGPPEVLVFAFYLVRDSVSRSSLNASPRLRLGGPQFPGSSVSTPTLTCRHTEITDELHTS